MSGLPFLNMRGEGGHNIGQRVIAGKRLSGGEGVHMLIVQVSVSTHPREGVTDTK